MKMPPIFQNKYNVTKAVGMNIGGKLSFEGGYVKWYQPFTPVLLPMAPMVAFSGYFFENEDVALYIAGDTALHGDMKLLPGFYIQTHCFDSSHWRFVYHGHGRRIEGSVDD